MSSSLIRSATSKTLRAALTLVAGEPSAIAVLNACTASPVAARRSAWAVLAISRVRRRCSAANTGQLANVAGCGSYLDTRASDSDCEIDFTVGTVAPFLMHKANTYTIGTWGDADFAVATAATRSRARLTAEVLDIDGIGCSMNEYPRGVIRAEGNPWCVDVAPPFGAIKAISFIKLPDFFVLYDGTCYKWQDGNGYTWCGGNYNNKPDPN